MSAMPEKLLPERPERGSEKDSPDASTQGIDEEAAAPHALSRFGAAIALWIIALVALVGGLHFARTFLFPCCSAHGYREDSRG